MNKRGQAALEFLMTYGWAILVVLIVIGALAYFGVLNPSMILPEKCSLSTGVACKDHLIDQDASKLMFTFSNGMGRGIYVTKVTVKGVKFGDAGCYTGDLMDNTNCDAAVPDGVCDYGGTSKGWHLSNGAEGTVTIETDLGAGSCTIDEFAGKTKGTIEILFYNDDSTSEFPHILEGELLAKSST